MVALLDEQVCFGSDARTAVADAEGDHLYSVAALTDSSGEVVERYRYDAYGQRSVDDADLDEVLLGNSFGFTGRRFDLETGLWYLRARYYSSGQGRFVGRDPLGYIDGKSMYAGYHVPNSVDPTGLSCGQCEIQEGTKKEKYCKERAWYGGCKCWGERDVANCVPDNQKIVAHAVGYAQCIKTAEDERHRLVAELNDLYAAWRAETARQFAQMMARCADTCKGSFLGEQNCLYLCESRVSA